MRSVTCCPGWREVIEGMLEICERAGPAIIGVDLVDEQTYRVRANAGPGALAQMRPGLFMIARIVPVGGDWMLSGAQQPFAASGRDAILRLAAEERATGYPRQPSHDRRE